MPRILRVNNADGEPIGAAESAEGVRQFELCPVLLIEQSP